MTISYRKLIKWRKEALHARDGELTRNAVITHLTSQEVLDSQERILALTQELIDEHLIRRKS